MKSCLNSNFKNVIYVTETIVSFGALVTYCRINLNDKDVVWQDASLSHQKCLFTCLREVFKYPSILFAVFLLNTTMK
jgi:hypothetical protein